MFSLREFNISTEIILILEKTILVASPKPSRKQCLLHSTISMRNPDRIPQIINALETLWKENPDYRLGQIIVATIKPLSPSPSIYYIEDDIILEKLLSFNDRSSTNNSKIPFWQKFSAIGRSKADDITIDIVIEMISELKRNGTKVTLTPVKILELIGAPTSDLSWLKTKEDTLSKLQEHLDQLHNNGTLAEVEIGFPI